MRKIIAAIALSALMAPVALMAHPGYGKTGERMAEELGLSAEQRTQVEAIMQDAREQRKAQREATREKMNAVLNEEQRSKLEQMHQDRRAQWEERKRERKHEHKSMH